MPVATIFLGVPMQRFARSLLAIALFVLPCAALAESVSLDEARLAGERFLAERGVLAADWAALAPAGEWTAIERGGRVLGYLLPLAPAGHVLVSSIRELPAVKSYSPLSSFDPDQPDGYPAMVLEVLEASLRFLEESYGSLASLPPSAAPPENRASWERLLAGGPLPREANEDSVGPLLASDWAQSGVFNGDCPIGDGGGNCLVGCVATSAAQILNYWKYPATGEGSHTYHWDGDDSCGGEPAPEYLSANFMDGYDWDNILDSYGGGYNAAQAAAVSELNYEVAVAFEMNFGVCASGSYVASGATVYKNFFRYADGTVFVQRNLHTQDEWWARIRAELDVFPPRVSHYRINSHSIICDGYDENGGRFYHMNYGWGSGSSAWYALDNLYCPWNGCNYIVEAFVAGIEPEGYFTVVEPAGGLILHHGDSLPDVAWGGSGGSDVVIDLYRGDEFVTRLSDWTANDGGETPAGAIDAAWGTGSQFRIKVVDDGLEFGYSAQFGIYGADVWADVTSGPLGDANSGQGVAWGDCDGDGWPDIYLANGGSQGNHLFGNVAGSFSDITAPPLDLSGYAFAVAWADIDNDGDLDLFAGEGNSSPNHLYRNDGGAFVEISSGPFAQSASTLGCAFADYDNDGLIDLYLVNTFAPDQLLHNEGGGVFADATAPPLGNAAYGRSAVWGDYDGDGDQDLYLVHNDSNKLYRNEGGGSFSDQSVAMGVNDGEHGYGAAWGDYDNDGDLDLYLTNDGPNRLLRNDGFGFTDVATPTLADAGRGTGVAWADYDLDGWLDLYLVKRGQNLLFRNDGGNFIDSTDPLLADQNDGVGAAWCDYDGDGDPDLYISNADAGNRLFQNDNSNGNHWLAVELVGSDSNRMAVGARLVAQVGGLTLTRQIGGDTGLYSQSELTVLFGLGSETLVTQLDIHWPGGDVETLNDLAADRRIVVEQESANTAVPAGAAGSLRLLANVPNPFNPKTAVRFSLAADGAVLLEILDPEGRRVRRLVAGAALRAGEHSVSWDGRNDAGELVASGIYFTRLVAGGRVRTGKMTLLK